MVEEPLIGMLDSVWSSIGAVCEPLAPADYDRPTDCPGWTVRDHLAHMIGTEAMLLQRQPPPSDVDTGALPHVRNDIGAFNEQWVIAHHGRPGAEVLADFRAIAAERLAALRALTAEEWDREGFTPDGPGPYRQFMATRVFDCWFHEQDIREAVGVPGGLEGAVADLAVGRIPKALPFVVGKKAAAPQGATVIFSVDGVEYAVRVDGRAALLDVPPADPTVRLTMSRRAFTRLAGGRWAGADALARGEVAIEGDADLGRAVVTNLGFTI